MKMSIALPENRPWNDLLVTTYLTITPRFHPRFFHVNVGRLVYVHLRDCETY